MGGRGGEDGTSPGGEGWNTRALRVEGGGGGREGVGELSALAGRSIIPSVKFPPGSFRPARKRFVDWSQ